MRRTRTRKDLWLLAFLALRPAQPLDRDWLAGLFWPDSEEGQALYNLRRSLSNLREALGEEAYRLTLSAPRALRLDLSGADVDVLAFDAGIARKDERALREAVARYRGPLLEGCLEEWVLPERREREQSYVAALEILASHSQDRQEWGEAIRLLREALTVEPLLETALRGLMKAHAAEANPASAVEVYRAFRLRLREELNMAPDAATEALYKQIRAEARRLTVSPASLPSSASREPVATNTNLPQPLTRIVGREKEREEIRAALEDTRLATLVGPGGIGKTRLALEIAGDLAEEFEDGVWFIDLAPLAEPALTAQAVAAALRIPEKVGEARIETAAQHLSSRQVLLVLDNCEHLIEECARVANTLLRSGSGVHILATSREPLGIIGELVWSVPPLSCPPRIEEAPHFDRSDKTELPALLMEYEAVRLLVERVRQAQPAFQMTAHTAPFAAQICRRLDGIPLALELAAKRIRGMTMEQIAARLDDRFRLLAGGSRAALPRHQTLQAMIDWSYDLLTDAERLLLRCLSVFSGQWTLDAAEGLFKEDGPLPPSFAFVSADDVLDLMTSLVEKSLVLREEARGEVCYRMLETIRQYAREKLQACGEAHEIGRRHSDWVIGWIEAGWAQLSGANQAAILNAWEAGHDNIRSALDFCAAEPNGMRKALHLAGKLWYFWYTRGYIAEARKRYTELLARPEAQSPCPERAKALSGAGVMAWTQGDCDAAKAFQEECLEIFRQLEDKYGVGVALGNLSLIAKEQRDLKTAIALQEECLEIARQFKNKKGIAVALVNLGNFYAVSGDFEAGLPLQEESLTIRRELEDNRGIVHSLCNTADTLLQTGRVQRAAAYLRECLELCLDVGDKHMTAFALEITATLQRLEGRCEIATQLHGAALSIRNKNNLPQQTDEQARSEKEWSELEEKLGRDRFQRLLMEGSSLQIEQAVDHALRNIDQPSNEIEALNSTFTPSAMESSG